MSEVVRIPEGGSAPSLADELARAFDDGDRRTPNRRGLDILSVVVANRARLFRALRADELLARLCAVVEGPNFEATSDETIMNVESAICDELDACMREDVCSTITQAERLTRAAIIALLEAVPESEFPNA